MAEVQTAFDDESFARTLPAIFGMCSAITLIGGNLKEHIASLKDGRLVLLRCLALAVLVGLPELS
jgi:hypothetical protein